VQVFEIALQIVVFEDKIRATRLRIEPAGINGMDASPSQSGRIVIVDVPAIPSDEVAVPSALAEHLRAVVHQGYDTVVLNVEALTHPDSMVLAAIVQTYVRAVKGGGTVKLMNVSKRFRELLTVTKLDRVMAVVEVDGDPPRIIVDRDPETAKTKIAEN